MTGDYAGSCSGILKVAGEWLSSPRLERAAIGWKRKNSKPLIDRVTWSSSVKYGDLSFPLDGINQPAAEDKVVLYTSGFFPTSISPTNGLNTISRNFTLNIADPSRHACTVPSLCSSTSYTRMHNPTRGLIWFDLFRCV